MQFLEIQNGRLHPDDRKMLVREWEIAAPGFSHENLLRPHGYFINERVEYEIHTKIVCQSSNHRSFVQAKLVFLMERMETSLEEIIETNRKNETWMEDETVAKYLKQLQQVPFTIFC